MHREAITGEPVRRPTWARRVAGWLPYLLAAAPPAFLIAIVLTQTVDVPFADQWALIPLLQHSYKHSLTFQDFWQQHNEHRLLFPRLAMLGLARLSGWNTRVEMLASVALAGALFAVLVAQVRQTGRLLGMRWQWLVPAISLAVFSLNQAESWWGGWNLQIFLSVLAVVACMALLTQASARIGTLGLAVACAVVASYSYGPGLLVWGAGAALLILRARPWSAAIGWRLALWCAAGVLTLAAFFYGYHWSAQTAPLASIVRAPGRYLVYTTMYLGAAPTRGAVEYLFGAITGDTYAICNLGDSDLCAMVGTAALAAGAGGVLLFAFGTWALLRRVALQTLLPYIGLGLYALASGLMTGLSRAAYGNNQALAQRYATNASLFWIALMILAALCAHAYGPHRWLGAAAKGLILAFGVSIALSTFQGLDHFRWQHSFLDPAREALLVGDDDALLQRLYPDPKIVRAGRAFLQQRHLSVFRTSPRATSP